MAARHIVPVEPASGSGDVVVVEVQQQGDRPLDIRLVGCEGENPYITTLEHRNLGKLKHKYKGSDEEWATILAHFLLEQQPEHGLNGILDGVGIVYTLRKKNLELSIRKDVQGIKVTLGEIVLERDDEFEFNPFEWAQASATAHRQTLSEVADLKARVGEEKDTIAKLNAQLQDFIKTKDEAETAMLQQFMQLLNEKKRKIRDQSRLLAGAKVDIGIASSVSSTRASNKTANTGASRRSKRKAPEQAAESDSDLVEMDQPKTEEHAEEEVPESTTPDHSDDETDTDDEAPRPQPSSGSTDTLRSTSVARNASSAVTESMGVPPPRSLPFVPQATRGGMTRGKPSSLPSVHDDDDETDDEEL
ncbi:hypothetical protein ACN47E_000852 [Coniothyrium glycines]